jgi:Nuclear transport factor 2 (NTF2) domain
MVAALDRAHLLAAVARSPRAAAAHDRAGWVGLFTGDGRIEDPVGSRPHVGHAQIGRFYDTFIGPRDIEFHRDLDIVVGTAVLRDLELEVSMDSAVTMYIPAFLRYDLRADLREGHGYWKIAQLRAYWELPAMMLQFLRAGRVRRRPLWRYRVICWPIRDCGGPRGSWPAFGGSARGARDGRKPSSARSPGKRYPRCGVPCPQGQQ